MEKPARFEDFRPYQVRVEGQTEIYYGIVDHLPRARREFDRGNCIVAHAYLPVSLAVPIASVTEIQLSRDPINQPDEYDRFVRAEYDRAQALSDSLGETLAPGKLFSIGVADGQAWYVVTKVTPKTCTVEWRGFCADRYTDQVLGWEGTFPRRVIEPLAIRQHRLRSIFSER